MGYNYQDAPRESQQEYFGKKTKRVVDLENQVRFMGMQIDNLKAICRTDNTETLQNALKRIEELEGQITRAFEVLADKRKRIKELETQVEKMKCCENCKCYKSCITCNESIGNNCDYYSGGNVCNNWKLN